MADHRTIRSEIQTLLADLAGIGPVHDYQRFAKRESTLLTHYVQTGRLKGWDISWTGSSESAPATGSRHRVDRWEIRGFFALDDADESELLFGDLLELVRATFRDNDTLHGLVDTCIVGDEAGIQIREIGHVLFAGVLCHRARLGLTTRTFL